MRIGWLRDDPGYIGGAELTMAEFRALAPGEVVDCPPGEVVTGLDRYVVGNCMTYAPEEVPGECVRYHHDVARAPADDLLDQTARHVFCSPLQQKRMGMEGVCIPPALDLARFRRPQTSNHRNGAVCIGRMAYGKGLEHLAEYPEPVDVYSSVPVPSEGSIRYRGASADVAETLRQYETFVFLPSALEPFGRAVVEAWAAGLTLVVNDNVGAVHWIANAQEKLESAAEDFWAHVLD